MPEQELRRIRGIPSASDFNRLAQAIASASRFTVGGTGTDAGLPGGRVIQFDRAGPIDAIITSGTNPYAWSYAARKADGTGWAAIATGGTTTKSPAYEITGKTNIAAGEVVRLWPGFQGDFRFQVVRRGCSGGNTFCVADACTTGKVAGAAVAILSGGSTVASCTTDATGCCGTASIPSGSYEVRVDDGTGIVYDATMSLAPCKSYTLGPYCCVKICVVVCGANAPWCPATVAIKNPSTGATVASGATGPDGCVTLRFSTYRAGGTTVDVVATPTDPRYQPRTTSLSVACATPPQRYVVGVAIADDTDVCCEGALLPAAMTLTDANGSYPFNYCYYDSGFGFVQQGWYACATASVYDRAEYPPECFFGGLTFGVPGLIGILYSGACAGIDPATGRPSFTVSRQWLLATGLGRLWYLGFPYDNGAQQPPCVAVHAGLGGCTIPGISDVCRPAAGFAWRGDCGSDSATGTAAFDPCEPFAATIPMAYAPGTSCGGRPTIGDPVGGSVSIS